MSGTLGSFCGRADAYTVNNHYLLSRQPSVDKTDRDRNEMPDHPWTVASYVTLSIVAGVGLGYVVVPTLFSNSSSNAHGSTGTKATVVGLSNPANDCFVNAVLQALASSPGLKQWLNSQIRVLHHLEARDESSPPQNNETVDLVTRALALILHRLSQEVQYRKTVSAKDFISSLEIAFASKLNRSQQDAHELLQMVLNRLQDEHQYRISRVKESGLDLAFLDESSENGGAYDGFAASDGQRNESSCKTPGLPSREKGASAHWNFPCRGELQSEIECLTCHFKPVARRSEFVVLSLNVPSKKSTSLDECLDGVLKQEFIDDYKCDRCRLSHAMTVKNRQAGRASPHEKSRLEQEMRIIEQAIETGTEVEPDQVRMPQTSTVPTTRITKHTRMTEDPALLAIHLSRSAFDPGGISRKNTANVAFEDKLSIGFLDRTDYRLMCVVCHVGRHDSGHYETYRRQSRQASREGDDSCRAGAAQGTGLDAQDEKNARAEASIGKKSRRRDRWWRVSDERAVECRTSDVLGAQSQAYMLLYEKVIP